MVLTTPGIVIYLMFGAWFAITLAVLLGMDVLEHLGRAFGTGRVGVLEPATLWVERYLKRNDDSIDLFLWDPLQ